MNAKRPNPSRRALIGWIGASLIWPSVGSAAPLATLSGTAFGTSWRIVGPPGAPLDGLRAEIEALFDRIDRQMSPWRADSALSRFNVAGAGWQPADAALVEVTGLALSLAVQSAGAFDPTVGPLVARWGFGPIAGAERSDWRGLSVGQGGIAKRRDALTLDLCGIAKGWALDRAVDLAQAAGFTDLLFDLGGELRALGHHPSGRAWQVAVEGPAPTARDPVMLRLAPGQAVATSGLNAQSYALGGQRYGHIIDPGAGRPADTALHSVTVLAGDSAHADGWATALFAAGDSAGPALAERHGIAALFLVEDGAGVRQIATGAMAGAIL